MSAVEDLTEVATRAARAEAAGRSAKWNDREALEKAPGASPTDSAKTATCCAGRR